MPSPVKADPNEPVNHLDREMSLRKAVRELGTKPTQRLCSCLSLWPFAGLPLDRESFLWNKLYLLPYTVHLL